MNKSDRSNIVIYMCGMVILILSLLFYSAELEQKIDINKNNIETICTHNVEFDNIVYCGTNDNMIIHEFPNIKCVNMVEFDKTQNVNNKIIVELR